MHMQLSYLISLDQLESEEWVKTMFPISVIFIVNLMTNISNCIMIAMINCYMRLYNDEIIMMIKRADTELFKVNNDEISIMIIVMMKYKMMILKMMISKRTDTELFEGFLCSRMRTGIKTPPQS